MRFAIFIFISTSLALLIPRCDDGYGEFDNLMVDTSSDALLVIMPRHLSMPATLLKSNITSSLLTLNYGMILPPKLLPELLRRFLAKLLRLRLWRHVL